MLLLIPVLVCACHSTRTVPLAPKQPGALPKQSWVVLLGGQRVAVEGGQATADSILGMRRDGGRFAVPRDSVVFVEGRTVSVARTVGLGAAGLGVLAVIAAIAVLAAFASLGE